VETYLPDTKSAAVAARCLYDEIISRSADHACFFVLMPDSSALAVAKWGVVIFIRKLFAVISQVSVLLGQGIWLSGFHDRAVRDEEKSCQRSALHCCQSVASWIVRKDWGLSVLECDMAVIFDK